MEIIANERIKSLEKFYARDASNSKNIIEENYKSKKTTDDAKGIWVTEQFKAAAVTLHVFAVYLTIGKWRGGTP